MGLEFLWSLTERKASMVTGERKYSLNCYIVLRHFTDRFTWEPSSSMLLNWWFSTSGWSFHLDLPYNHHPVDDLIAENILTGETILDMYRAIVLMAKSMTTTLVSGRHGTGSSSPLWLWVFLSIYIYGVWDLQRLCRCWRWNHLISIGPWGGCFVNSSMNPRG